MELLGFSLLASNEFSFHPIKRNSPETNFLRTLKEKAQREEGAVLWSQNYIESEPF